MPGYQRRGGACLFRLTISSSATKHKLFGRDSTRSHFNAADVGELSYLHCVSSDKTPSGAVRT